MNPKLFQLLGMSMRAGMLVSGEEQVVLGIRQQKIRLVCLSEDASSNTKKKVTDKAAFYKVPMIIVDSRDELARAIGKDRRVVVGITDAGFAKKMQGLHEG
jgi:ribosomal protein L7Ae-like RNA K-turn-binding protein